MKYLGIALLINIIHIISFSIIRKSVLVLYTEIVIFFVSLVVLSIFIKLSKIKTQKEILLIAALVALYFTGIPFILSGSSYFVEDWTTHIIKSISFFIASYFGAALSLYIFKIHPRG